MNSFSTAIRVTVRSVNSLIGRNPDGLSNPYVVVTVEESNGSGCPRSAATKPAWGVLSAEYNEVLDFAVSSLPANITFRVWSKSRNSTGVNTGDDDFFCGVAQMVVSSPCEYEERTILLTDGGDSALAEKAFFGCGTIAFSYEVSPPLGSPPASSSLGLPSSLVSGFSSGEADQDAPWRQLSSPRAPSTLSTALPAPVPVPTRAAPTAGGGEGGCVVPMPVTSMVNVNSAEQLSSPSYSSVPPSSPPPSESTFASFSALGLVPLPASTTFFNSSMSSAGGRAAYQSFSSPSPSTPVVPPPPPSIPLPAATSTLLGSSSVESYSPSSNVFPTSANTTTTGVMTVPLNNGGAPTSSNIHPTPLASIPSFMKGMPSPPPPPSSFPLPTPSAVPPPPPTSESMAVSSPSARHCSFVPSSVAVPPPSSPRGSVGEENARPIQGSPSYLHPPSPEENNNHRNDTNSSNSLGSVAGGGCSTSTAMPEKSAVLPSISGYPSYYTPDHSLAFPNSFLDSSVHFGSSSSAAAAGGGTTVPSPVPSSAIPSYSPPSIPPCTNATTMLAAASSAQQVIEPPPTFSCPTQDVANSIAINKKKKKKKESSASSVRKHREKSHSSGSTSSREKQQHKTSSGGRVFAMPLPRATKRAITSTTSSRHSGGPSSSRNSCLPHPHPHPPPLPGTTVAPVTRHVSGRDVADPHRTSRSVVPLSVQSSTPTSPPPPHPNNSSSVLLSNASPATTSSTRTIASSHCGSNGGGGRDEDNGNRSETAVPGYSKGGRDSKTQRLYVKARDAYPSLYPEEAVAGRGGGGGGRRTGEGGDCFLAGLRSAKKLYSDAYYLFQLSSTGRNTEVFRRMRELDLQLDGGFTSCRDYAGRTLLHVAAWHGQTEVLRILLSPLPRPPLLDLRSLVSTLSKDTILHSAAKGGQEVVILWIRTAYPSIAALLQEQRNARGWTPGECAMASGFRDAAELLISVSKR